MKKYNSTSPVSLGSSPLRVQMPLVILLVILAATVCDCLLCFQCAATSMDDPCVTNYEAFVNTSRDMNDYSEENRLPFYKNCTDSKETWDRCFIEKLHGQNGQVILYQRGCHDGITFPKDLGSPRFQGLTPNNFTTCAYVAKQEACFSFCLGDFCNGPQFINTTKDLCVESNGTVGCGAKHLRAGNYNLPDATVVLMYVMLFLALPVFLIRST